MASMMDSSIRARSVAALQRCDLSLRGWNIEINSLQKPQRWRNAGRGSVAAAPTPQPADHPKRIKYHGDMGLAARPGGVILGPGGERSRRRPLRSSAQAGIAGGPGAGALARSASRSTRLTEQGRACCRARAGSARRQWRTYPPPNLPVIVRVFTISCACSTNHPRFRRVILGFGGSSSVSEGRRSPSSSPPPGRRPHLPGGFRRPAELEGLTPVFASARPSYPCRCAFGPVGEFSENANPTSAING